MPKFYARITYRKTGLVRFSSHRDLIGIFSKAVKRSGIPIAYSQGYNPKPQISYFNPLQVGVASDCEIAVFQLEEYMKPGDIRMKLSAQLPSGFELIDVSHNQGKKVRIDSTEYSCPLVGVDSAAVKGRIQDVVNGSIILKKERKDTELNPDEVLGFIRVEKGYLLFSIRNDVASTVSPRELLKAVFEEKEALKRLASLTRKSINEKV